MQCGESRIVLNIHLLRKLFPQIDALFNQMHVNVSTRRVCVISCSWFRSCIDSRWTARGLFVDWVFFASGQGVVLRCVHKI